MNERHEHRLDIDNAVATVTLERPAAYNALTRKLLDALFATLKEIERNPAVRAVVITGAGNGFCAGQALDDADTIRPDGAMDLYAAVSEGFNPMIRLLLTLEKPVIAAVNGVAAGAGFGLALACDFRIVAHSATFTTAFAKIGLVPDSGVSFLLPRIVGYAKALELCMLSGKIDAAAASALGLVTELAPLDDVVGRAQALGAQLAAGPRALGLIKRQLLRNGVGDIAGALRYEAEMQSVAGATSDAIEGIAAFSAKRRAVFSGR